MNFADWLDDNDEKFANYQCYTEYGGDVGDLLELAWKAAQEAILEDLAQHIEYKIKEL